MLNLANEIEDLSLLLEQSLITKEEFDKIKSQLLENSKKNREISYSLKVSPSEIVNLKKQLDKGNITHQEFDTQLKKLTSLSMYIKLFTDKKFKRKFILLQILLFIGVSTFYIYGRNLTKCIDATYVNNVEFTLKTSNALYHQVFSTINYTRFEIFNSKWKNNNPISFSPASEAESLEDWGKMIHDIQADHFQNLNKALNNYHKVNLNNYFLSSQFLSSWYTQCLLKDNNFGHEKSRNLLNNYFNIGN